MEQVAQRQHQYPVQHTVLAHSDPLGLGRAGISPKVLAPGHYWPCQVKFLLDKELRKFLPKASRKALDQRSPQQLNIQVLVLLGLLLWR